MPIVQGIYQRGAAIVNRFSVGCCPRRIARNALEFVSGRVVQEDRLNWFYAISIEVLLPSQTPLRHEGEKATARTSRRNTLSGFPWSQRQLSWRYTPDCGVFLRE